MTQKFARLFSFDLPKSRLLSLVLLVLFISLLLAPFLFPGTRSLDTAAKILIFMVLAASYDILLGYTGIVSFAHTMFFGLGAYGVAITLDRYGGGFFQLFLGATVGMALALVLSFAIGLLSLRVRAIFFAMMTLAFASAFALLVSQFYTLTGGEDGLSYKLPRLFTPAFKLFSDKVFGVTINGRILTYYLIFFIAAGVFLVLLRFVNSPFGTVLKAIRENEFRAEAIGYDVARYRTLSTVFSSVIAALAGVMMAMWLRYTGPDTVLSLTIMLNILLMVMIGGMGTLYGPVIGAALFILAENYLHTLLGSLSSGLASIPVLSNLFHPDRWLLWLGVLFVLSVYFFPGGIVGKLRTLKKRG